MAVQPKSGAVLYLVYLRRGSISAESQHPAHKKINGVPPQPPNIDWRPFNLIWAFFEWLENEILKIWDFWKMSGSHFSKTHKKCVLKMPPICPVLFFKNPQTMVFEKIQNFEQLPGSKIPLLAIHKIISHIWEDAPRKVNNDEPDLRFFHGNFWPVISRTVWKPCPEGWLWVLPFP